MFSVVIIIEYSRHITVLYIYVMYIYTYTYFMKNLDNNVLHCVQSISTIAI